MKGHEIDAAGDEERCQSAGDVIERALPVAQPALNAAEWERLQDALARPARRGLPARRRRLLAAALALAGAAGAAAFLLSRARPLSVVVDAEAADDAEHGRLVSAAGRSAVLHFSDGSRIVLATGSAGRVAARTADGATFAVERGHASFDVVHRARTRWTVAAGPFDVLVTGTSFDVDWSGARAGRLVVDLHAGSVTVRGAMAGSGVSLRAGQRLLADLTQGSLRVVEGGTETAPAPAPAGAPQEGAGPAAEASATAHEDRGASDERDDRRERGDRSKPARAGLTTGDEGQVPPALSAGAPTFTPPPDEPARLPTEPEPWSPSGELAYEKLAAGGASCLGWSPQIRFDGLDRTLDGIQVASDVSLAFTRPAIDRARSWCGKGSLRVDARFDLTGAPNRLGHRPRHAGEVLVPLPAAVDLTGKTVTVHFFVEGPTDIRFGAQLFAVNRPAASDPKWVGGGFTQGLTGGRWWTLTHTFERENRLYEGGTSPVDHVEKITLQLYAIGNDRVWTGRVFVDDVGWQ